MLNNLNTSVALAKSLEGVRLIQKQKSLSNASALTAKSFLDQVNQLLGIVRLESQVTPTAKSESEMDTLDELLINTKLAERHDAKSRKDFAVADSIRTELEAMGIEIQDTPSGTTWKRKSLV